MIAKTLLGWHPSNLVPYIVIAAMGMLIYILWDKNQELKIKEMELQSSIEIMEYNQGEIAKYMTSEIAELKASREVEWVEGKHYESGI